MPDSLMARPIIWRLLIRDFRILQSASAVTFYWLSCLF